MLRETAILFVSEYACRRTVEKKPQTTETGEYGKQRVLMSVRLFDIRSVKLHANMGPSHCGQQNLSWLDTSYRLHGFHIDIRFPSYLQVRICTASCCAFPTTESQAANVPTGVTSPPRSVIDPVVMYQRMWWSVGTTVATAAIVCDPDVELHHND
ncbi:hypothetical protein AB6A40_004098 [Gnathostoma spinigerum]|uniref:Uncharacterized protein n=1 Tax=Gnathostoma spinigerum TaxID=75299 RepID=A0ABD6EJ63_9BILA